MEIAEGGSLETNPVDTELGKSPVLKSPGSDNVDGLKQMMPPKPSPPQMAKEIAIGETCDERNRTMEHGSEGVEEESDHLPILEDQPSSPNEMPTVYAPHEHMVHVTINHDCYKEISMDELITTLKASQLEKLDLKFAPLAHFDDEVEDRRSSRQEAYEKHRLEVVDTIATCQKSLKELIIQPDLNVEEVEVLCGSLVSHPTLEVLLLWIAIAEHGGSKEVEIVCNMLKSNRSIKRLVLFGCGLTLESQCGCLGSMLGVNSTLQELEVFGGRPEGVEVLLRPLIGRDGQPPLNNSLQTLICFAFEIGERGARALAEMLRTNRSLTYLSIKRASGLEQLDVCTILESLENNQTLQTLDIKQCEGVRGDEVLAKMMDLLRVNPWLKEICLDGTPLEREGHDAQVKAQLEMNARDYMAVVKGMPRVPPKFARVFLCGDAYSGKTTLRRSMVRSLSKSFKTKNFISLVEVIELRKPLQFCFNDPEEFAKRTRGIQINVLVDNEDQKISVWDLAGQEEYHAFHDTMIPDLSIQGNVCYFLLVCNPFHNQTGKEKTADEIHDEIQCWLRFISSNTKRSLTSPPQVLIILTHGDKGFQGKVLVDIRIKRLKEKFDAFVKLSATSHLINAHSASETKNVVDDVKNNCATLFRKVSYVYKTCMDVQHGLCQWNLKHPNQPIVTMKTFENDIVCKQEPNLRNLVSIETQLVKPHVAIAMFLHDAGEVIYFKDEDFLVVNPNWFCNEVMGHLIKLQGDSKNDGWDNIFQNGFGDIEDIENLLKSSLKKIKHNNCMGNAIDIPKYLVRLLKKMHFAYEEEFQEVQDAPNSTRIFVPTTLEKDDDVTKGERCLEWKCMFPPNTEVIHLGRRLQCTDQELTTLTPGFFPRIQVALYNHFRKLPMEAICNNEKNLFKASINGMEIFVELSGEQMKCHVFIDILGRSSKSKLETLEFINKHVVGEIEQLCGVAQVGCQGVALVQGILRPKVVEKLVLCKARKDQAVLVEDLKQKLLGTNIDESYTHAWKEVPNCLKESMEDTATSLLGEVETDEVFQRRHHELVELEIRVKQLQSDKKQFQDSQGLENEIAMDSPRNIVQQQFVDSQSRGECFSSQNLVESICNAIVPPITNQLRSMEQRLDKKLSTLEKSMEETKQLIGSIENRLHNTLRMELDNVLNLSSELQQRQVPCNVYFTTTDANGLRKLVVKMLPGIETVRLHLLCEHIEGIHVVGDQGGEIITLMSSKVRKCVPYLVTGLTIFSLLLKVGAHVLVGVGDMIPNFGKGLLLAFDTDCLGNYLPHGGVLRMPEQHPLQGNGKLIDKESALVENKKSAEQWLVDFLKEKNIYKSFGLLRVKYHKTKSNNQGSVIRWVCSKCRDNGKQEKMLEDFPV